MGSAVKWGIILALAVSLFNVIWVLTGMHTSLPAAAGYLAVVVVLNIIAVILALRESAAQNRYGRQLAAGLVLGAVGGVVIFLSAFLMLTFVFPDMIPQQVEGFTAAYRSMPLSEEQQEVAIAALDAVTPFNQAIQGAMGTLVTSLIAGAVTGAFLRKKG